MALNLSWGGFANRSEGRPGSATVSLRRTLDCHCQWEPRIAFSPDGRILATASKDHTVSLWEVSTGELRATLSGHKKGITSINFSPDGRRLVTASQDKTARLWDVSSGGLKATLAGQEDWVMRAIFSPNGRSLLTIADCPLLRFRGCKGTARLWDAETGVLKADLLERCEGSPRGNFSADGRHVVLVCNGSKARVWNTDSATLEATFKVEYPYRFWDATFSPNGDLVATEDSVGRVLLWDMNTKQLLATLPHDGTVYAMEFSPNGKLLATASADSNARIWDVPTGALLWRFSNATRVSNVNFSPDGKTLATNEVEKSKTKLWDVATGKLKAELPAQRVVLGPILFTPDGKIIATAGYSVNVGNALTGEHIATLKDAFFPIAFSPDDRTLATAGPYNTVLLWDLVPWLSPTSRQRSSHRWPAPFGHEYKAVAGT